MRDFFSIVDHIIGGNFLVPSAETKSAESVTDKFNLGKMDGENREMLV
jgi:hypothetical protein